MKYTLRSILINLLDLVYVVLTGVKRAVRPISSSYLKIILNNQKNQIKSVNANVVLTT